MSPERWRQIEELYHAAQERPPSERASFLVEAAGGDAALVHEVETLLAQTGGASDLLDHPAVVGLESEGDTPAATQFESGVQIGQYRIETLLGQGGMGVVYRALDTKLNRPVAVKFLAGELADAAARHRFQREAWMASSLNHPHILTVHDVGEFESKLYLVTEFIDGGTLKDWKRGAPRTPVQVLNLLTGVADGLATAHEAGMLHRDVKPANILVTLSGYAKLADFGLAKPAASRTTAGNTTRSGAIVGTIAYMSPEQGSGKPVDARSDIFSFGVVLFEMLADRRPFTGATDLEVLQKILHGKAEPLPDGFPETLRAVIAKALEKDPAQRWQSMRELVEELRRNQRLLSPEAPAPRRRVLPAVAAAVFLLALATVWVLWQREYFWRNPLSGARVERLTDFPGDETSAAISPDGKMIVFLSDRGGRFDAWVGQTNGGEFVNVSKGKFTALAPNVMRLVGFSGDMSQVWFMEGQMSGPWNTLATPVLGGATHPFMVGGIEPAWSPDGARIAYHTADAGDPIFIADRSASKPRQVSIVRPGMHCHFLTWSPDGRFIYFAHGANTTNEMDIWRIPVSDNAPASVGERITRHNARVSSLAFLDSRTLIYSATAEHGAGDWLYTVDVERRIPHRVSSGVTEQYLSVAVSSTDPPRVIASVAAPAASLFSVPVSGNVQPEAVVSPFPVSNTRAHTPRFAHDYLVFLSSRSGSDGLWKLEREAATELWKSSEGDPIGSPEISPDGTQICFSLRKRDRTGLYLVNANGTNARTLTESLDVRGPISWSPDGKMLAVSASDGQSSYVYTVPLDGGAPMRLVNTPSYHPLWSPDGKFLLYTEPFKGGSLSVRGVTPEGTPVPMPAIQVHFTVSTPYRFLPGQNAIVVLRGFLQDFYQVDLESGKERRLTELKSRNRIQSFDVTPDGKQIVFDRWQDNTDIVLMDLPRR